jgi:tubulin beta
MFRTFRVSDRLLTCVSDFVTSTQGGKYVPRAVLFDLEPGVIGAVRASLLGELFRLGYLVILNA